MDELPIACSLTDEQMARAKAQYSAAQHLYTATARIGDGEAVVELAGEKADLGPFLRAMVQREAQCCAFLTYELSETADGFRLRLGSPQLDAPAFGTFVAVLFPSAAQVVSDTK